jgi:Na+/H+-translocating membrane pyrophosphatase
VNALAVLAILLVAAATVVFILAPTAFLVIAVLVGAAVFVGLDWSTEGRPRA